MEKHILILTHGKFGEELLRSVEMIVGPVENVTTGSLMPGFPPEEFLELITEQIKSIDEETEVLCLVDLFGGTPCNTALRINYDRPLRIVPGLSLPLLIEAVSQRAFLDMDSLVSTIVEAANSACFDVLSKRKVEG